MGLFGAPLDLLVRSVRRRYASPLDGFLRLLETAGREEFQLRGSIALQALDRTVQPVPGLLGLQRPRNVQRWREQQTDPDYAFDTAVPTLAVSTGAVSTGAVSTGAVSTGAETCSEQDLLAASIGDLAPKELA